MRIDCHLLQDENNNKTSGTLARAAVVLGLLTVPSGARSFAGNESMHRGASIKRASRPGGSASSRRAYALCALSTCAGLLACDGRDATTGKSGDRPNVLLITVCSIRADHMSVYGYHRQTTPNLARFAKDAVVFEYAITQWPKTAPALAALMTAKYGHSNGVMRVVPDQWLADEHITLAEVLAGAGYETVAFLATAAAGSATNIPQGFDLVEEVWRDRRRHILPTERTLAWLRREWSARRPFFVWAHYNNAHYPYTGGGVRPDLFVGDEFYDASQRVRIHADRRMRLKLPIRSTHPYAHPILRPDIGGVHWRAIPRERPRELANYVARYDASILGADKAIGRLISGIAEMDLLTNTIIAVVGDHGESLGEHNYFMEHGRFPYEPSVCVPMLIRPPGGIQPSRIETPIPTFGLAPTLLEMVNLQAPRDWEAESLWPVVRHEAKIAFVFTESGYQLNYTLAVRDDLWKLIHVPNPVDQQLQRGYEYELYAWREDPAEQHDLIDIEPQQAERLKKALNDWSEPWVHRAFQFAPPSTRTPDPDTIRQLRSLGYVGDARPSTRPYRKDDPKKP